MASVTDTTMPIKWRLAAVMADREMDYKQVAELTGMHKVTISKLKNTYEMPPRLDRDTLEKLCRVLNCQPGDLLRYDSSDRPTSPTSSEQ
jgi:putative transcriptional regulator